MKREAAGYAVQRFNDLALELEELIRGLGLEALQCRVRQKGDAVSPDEGWMFHALGMDAGTGAVWGELTETRDGRQKSVVVFMDTDSIDSIEFEVYHGAPDPGA